MSGVLMITQDNTTEPETSNLPTPQAPSMREQLVNLTGYNDISSYLFGSEYQPVPTPLEAPPSVLVSPQQLADMGNGMNIAAANAPAPEPETPIPANASPNPFLDQVRAKLSVAREKFQGASHG